MSLGERTNSSSSFADDASSLLDSELLARLQNVGSRVRRSVSEGYQTHRFANPTTGQRGAFSRSTSNPILTAEDNPIFRSANDTLHTVYTQHTGGRPKQSDRKRGHAQSIIEEADEDVDEEDSVQAPVGSGKSELRPIKALPATRAFRQTQSLPASMFGASGRGSSATAFYPAASAIQEEDDWSTAAFASPTAAKASG